MASEQILRVRGLFNHSVDLKSQGQGEGFTLTNHKLADLLRMRENIILGRPAHEGQGFGVIARTPASQAIWTNPPSPDPSTPPAHAHSLEQEGRLSFQCQAWNDQGYVRWLLEEIKTGKPSKAMIRLAQYFQDMQAGGRDRYGAAIPETAHHGYMALHHEDCGSEDNLVAILDTGCNATCHGSEWLKQYPPTPVEEGGARKGVPSLRGQTQVAGVREVRPDKWKQTAFFSRDSEAAFGSESATREGSFWTRIRLGKVVAAPGVRGQDAREKWTKTIAGEARFGPELDWEKPWRHQVFGARMREKNGRKLSLFSKDPEAAFGTESATRGGSF